MNSCGIYKIENLVNGHIYIGQTTQINNRFSEHKYSFRNGKHHNPYFQNAWNKYGEAAFVYKVLLICENFELTYYEQKMVDSLSPVYNVCRVCVNSTLGTKHSEEDKKKMTAHLKGNTFTLGHKLSEDHKKKISFSLLGNTRRRGKVSSDETKKKLSEVHKGKMPWNFGKHLSREIRERISKATTGIPKTEETRKKMSDFKTAWWKKKKEEGKI